MKTAHNIDQAVDRIIDSYEFSEPLNDLNQLERITSYNDIVGSYHKDDSQQSDVVLYRYKDSYFVTDELVSPEYIQFFGPKYDVTSFIKPGQCFACIVGAPTSNCTCAQLKTLH